MIRDVAVTVDDEQVNHSGGYYSEEDSDAGAFELTVADRAMDVSDADEVRFTVDGEADFTGKVERIRRVTAGRTPDRQLFVLLGRDWLSEFDGAPVSPPLGPSVVPAADVVRFDWTHPALPRDTWVTPTYLGSLFTADVDAFGDPAGPPVGAKTGYDPEGHPDVFTGWIWSAPTNEVGSHPLGTSYFYLPIPCAAGPLVPVFTFDDTGELAFDGIVIDEGVEPPAIMWTDAHASGLANVSAATHHVCVKATNTAIDTDWVGGNPGAIAVTLYQRVVSAFFEFDNVIARTGLNVSSSDPTQGGGWRCLHNPASPPGFTWGHACRLLFDQAQTEGHLPGWSLGFTDELDSNGNAWPVTPEITATVNESLLAWFRQSHARGFCDVRARPGERVLDAYRWRERGDFWTEPESRPVWARAQIEESSGERTR